MPPRFHPISGAPLPGRHPIPKTAIPEAAVIRTIYVYSVPATEDQEAGVVTKEFQYRVTTSLKELLGQADLFLPRGAFFDHVEIYPVGPEKPTH